MGCINTENLLINKAVKYSVGVSALLCFAQIVGSSFIIAAVLALYLALVCWSARNEISIPVLLYFLPWATLLKLQPGTMSFYTIALLIVCVLKPQIKIKKKYIFIAVTIFILTMISKLIYGYAVSNSYLLFLVLLILFPGLIEEYGKNYNFKDMVIVFSIGIIIAALAAQQFMAYPNINRYIIDNSYKKITRLAGFYGDANFYSAHISAALSGIVILINTEKERKNILKYMFAVLILLYCGLLAASKTFIFIVAVIVLLWVARVLRQQGRLTTKIVVVISLLAAVLFVATSTLFSDLLTIVYMRFDNAGTVSGLTTGRSDIWLNYIRELMSDMYLLFMGSGYSNVKLDGRGSHNTMIQLVFQFGIIGGTILLTWVKNFAINPIISELKRIKKMDLYIMMVGMFTFWLALDMLFFDEFFLIPLLFVAGVNYVNDNIRVNNK